MAAALGVCWSGATQDGVKTSDASRAADPAGPPPTLDSQGAGYQRQPRDEQSGLLLWKVDPPRRHWVASSLRNPGADVKVTFLKIRKVIRGNHFYKHPPPSFVSALLTHMNSFP